MIYGSRVHQPITFTASASDIEVLGSPPSVLRLTPPHVPIVRRPSINRVSSSKTTPAFLESISKQLQIESVDHLLAPDKTLILLFFLIQQFSPSFTVSNVNKHVREKMVHMHRLRPFIRLTPFLISFPRASV
ncbi:unnamed protein product [Caenorhabditis nigoni]